jgi:hypothetical protein
LWILLYISDPLSFKESILISLEALSDYEYLREFVESIPSSVGVLKLDPSGEVAEGIKGCLAEFKTTKTFFWLREDFKNALYDIERQLNKQVC